VQPSGEYDFRALVEQSERLQRQMIEAQLTLAETEVIGRAPTGAPRSVRIAPSAVDLDDLAGLEKLVLAALVDAQAQLRRTAEAMLAPVNQLFGQVQ
jgi:DNA-binding protein YbaB